MRIPEPAPTGPLPSELASRMNELAHELGPLYRESQRRYLYWDRFKQRPMPEGVAPDDAWRFVKLMRSLNRQPTPVRDAKGGIFTYELSDEVMRGLHVVDKWAGGWDAGSLTALPSELERERYIVNSLVEESIASSLIEGASTTRKRAREMLLNAETPKSHGERMILNNYQTMKRIRSFVDQPVTPELLLELQASMTEGTLANPDDVGAFRCANDIVVADEYNNILYTPPPCDRIPSLLGKLCDYANTDRGAFQHPVIKAIALHFWLALIHPFADGNGRTARALFYLYMLKQGYWLFEYLSISRIILRRRAQYERAYLYSEIDDCDFTYFLLFNLRAIESALKEMREWVAEKAEEDRLISERLQGAEDLNYRQRAALGRALRKADAVFTIQSHATSHGVVRATSRSDLLELERLGYLIRRRRGREHVFMPAPDIRDRLSGVL